MPTHASILSRCHVLCPHRRLTRRETNLRKQLESGLIASGENSAIRYSQDAKRIAPHVSHECLLEALKLELNYLKEDLAANAGDRSDKAFVHNA